LILEVLQKKVGHRIHRWSKSPPLITSLTEKPVLPKQKNFFQCRLEDLPRLLSLLPGL